MIQAANLKWVGAVVLGLVLWMLLVSGTLLLGSKSEPGGKLLRTTPEKPFSAGTAPRAVSEPYTGDLAIFEDADRAENLHVEQILDILNITDGKTVADIGAGSGWFTVRAARRVKEKGKVYAVEINREYLNHIEQRATAEGLANVLGVLGRPDDPELPAASIDSALVLNTYHEIAEPITLMKRLKAAIRPNGLVGIIDRNGNGADHGIAGQTIIDEMNAAGFERVGKFDFVKTAGMDYFLVFKPTAN